MTARVLVTRPANQARPLIAALTAAGFATEVVPAIAILPLATSAEVSVALTTLRTAHADPWVALTSANAVRVLLDHVDPGDLDGLRIAAVGQATAAALRDAGVSVDIVPNEENAGALAAAMVEVGVAGVTVWLPQAQRARPLLAASLSAAGAGVLVTPLYRSVAPPNLAKGLRAALQRGVDAVVVHSGSAVVNLLAAAAVPPVPLVCIGAQTAEEITRAGRVAVVASSTRPDDVVAAVRRALR